MKRLLLLLFTVPAMAQQPPIPPGRQYPYITTVSVTVTSVVTKVTEHEFLRVVQQTNAGTPLAGWRTNYLAMNTNLLSVTETNSPIRPQ